MWMDGGAPSAAKLQIGSPRNRENREKNERNAEKQLLRRQKPLRGVQVLSGVGDHYVVI